MDLKAYRVPALSAGLAVKLLTAILFLLLVIPTSVFTATPEPVKPEEITFTILYNNDAGEPYREDWLILEEYRKRKGVQFRPRFGDDDNYNITLVETLDSGNIPDIVLKVFPDEIAPYANSGLLLPFSDYLDKMPFFTAYIEKHQLEDELDRLRMDDGKLYILPGFQRPLQVQQWIYRRDLFDTHNLGVPATFGELKEQLAYLKERYPQSKPITACWGGAHLMAMLGAAHGIPAGWNGNRFYREATDTWEYAPATSNARALYTFLYECHQAGLLDPELFTQDYAAYERKLTNGTAIVTANWITSGFEPWNRLLRSSGIPDGEWAPLPVPESSLGIRALPPIETFNKGLIVPADAAIKPYFNELIAFIDWAVYSEEGMELTSWGVENVTFTYDENGNKTFLPGILTVGVEENKLNMKRDFGLDAIFNLNKDISLVEYKRPAEINAFLRKSLERGDAANPAPQLTLSAIQMKTVNEILTRVNAYAADAIVQFATGKLDPEADWDYYLSELEKRGFRSAEIIWNRAWKDGGH